MREFTVRELAEACEGKVSGDHGLKISSVAGVETAGDGELTFVVDEKRLGMLKQSGASAAIVPPGLEGKTGLKAEIIAKNPRLALAKVCRLFIPEISFGVNDKSKAFIGEGADISPKATIAPMAFVGENAVVGENTVVYPLAYIAERARVGKDCIIYPQAFVGRDCLIGNRVILNPGAKIGGDGFGFEFDGSSHVKIPHLGNVILEDDVEIGANTTIDRGTLGSTKISRGTKLDNLIMIGHNCEVGENSVMAAQVGLAGSVKIGRNVVLAGQVGVSTGAKVGDGVMAGGKTGINNDIKPGEKIMGLPQQPFNEWLRTANLLKKLPELYKKLKNISKRLSEIETRLDRLDD